MGQVLGGGVCSKFGGVSAPNLGGFLQISGGGIFFWWGGVPPNFWGVYLGGAGSSKFSGGVPPNFRGGGGSPPEYGQRSAGTHPTGMHHCFQ